MCKSKHNEADGDIPKFLCRDCNPDAFKPSAPVAEVQAPTVDPEMRAKIIKHRIGKLRKEEKRLSKLIDDIARRDPVRTRQLYDAIKIVEKDIDAERAKL